MSIFRILFVIALVSMSIPAHAQETISAEKRALLKEMLDATSAAATFESFLKPMAVQLRKVIKEANPNLTEEQMSFIESDVVSVYRESLKTESFNESLYKIYAKHFSVDELREINAFYKSPAGQKSNKVMPLIAEDSMTFGQKWSQSLVPTIQKRITERMAQFNKTSP